MHFRIVVPDLNYRVSLRVLVRVVCMCIAGWTGSTTRNSRDLHEARFSYTSDLLSVVIGKDL